MTKREAEIITGTQLSVLIGIQDTIKFLMDETACEDLKKQLKMSHDFLSCAWGAMYGIKYGDGYELPEYIFAICRRILDEREKNNHDD